MTSLLITGGRVIDPASNMDEVADMLIEDGRVSVIGAAWQPSGLAPPHRRLRRRR
jgi:dihydroorotase